MQPNVTFTAAGARVGVRQTLPVAVSIFAYGTIFGVLSRQQGLSLAEAAAMSIFVFAGASQMIALTMWASPLPILPIIVTTFIVNLRHLMMSAAVYPWLSRVSTPRALLSAFVITDESWALSVQQFFAGKNDAAFLLGSGLTVFASWLGATLSGHLLGSVISDPERLGLDFAFSAVFIALLAGMWKGRATLLPWAVAAVVAVVASLVVPGKWYILLGGLAGSLAGVIDGDE